MKSTNSKELTHESGKEFYAQGASIDPIVKQIAESVYKKEQIGKKSVGRDAR